MLFIVGEMDPSVIALNEQAQTRMKAASRMHIVPGATHLFEEKGALEEVARLATEWFVQNMPIR
jgi:pimeloyl-ACP methyl ester carboxylesterase